MKSLYLFLFLAISLFFTTSCKKYKEQIQTLTYRVDSLNLELNTCFRDFDDLISKHEGLNEDYKNHLFKLKKDFVDMTGIFSKIFINQVAIEEAMSEIRIEEGKIFAIEPSVLNKMNGYKQEIDNYLNSVENKLEEVTNDAQYLKGIDQFGEEKQEIINGLRGRLNREREKQVKLTQKIAKLEATVESMQLQLASSQDTFIQKYNRMSSENNRLVSDLKSANLRIEDMRETMNRWREYFTEEIRIKDSITFALGDTINNRDSLITQLQNSIANGKMVYYLFGDKKSLKRKNIIKNYNQGKLECNYKDEVLSQSNAREVPLLLTETIPIPRGTDIDELKLLPRRPNTSYQILKEEREIFIIDKAAFWQVGEVLVVGEG